VTALIDPKPSVAPHGHVEKHGRKLVYCAACWLPRPSGGWVHDCAAAAKKDEAA
jgi:hypothetical protein